MPSSPQRTSPELVLRVFTHPACAGCPAAVRDAWRAAGSHPEVVLRTVALDSREGLAEARSARVTTIPTLVLSAGERELERWVGAPAAGELAAGLERRLTGAG